MSSPNWQSGPELIFKVSPVVPVIILEHAADAIPLAEALLAGGINIMEITLRTSAALDAISLLTKTLPELWIGAGTVVTPDQLCQVTAAGAKFAISPGQTEAMLNAGMKGSIPFIPGIASPAELMMGLERGYTHFKLFPAEATGGIGMLRALYGPFPNARFCPTGGISAKNHQDYLALPNVDCVGGSWLVPEEALRQRNWSLIKDLATALPRSNFKE